MWKEGILARLNVIQQHQMTLWSICAQVADVNKAMKS